MKEIPFYWKSGTFTGPLEATIVAIKGDKIQLDPNIFYPEGGGQPSDTGTLEKQNTNINVLNAIESNEGEVWVQVDNSNELSVGDRVVARVNSARRLNLARMHSGQHLLSAILERNYGVETTRVEMHEHESQIGVSPKLTEEELEQVEQSVNKIIHQGIPISSLMLGIDNLDEINLRGDQIPQGKEIYRVVQIGDGDEILDQNLCGGTHLSNTKDIQLLLISSVEGKKIRFKCGYAAMEYATHLSKIARTIRTTFTMPISSVPQKIEAIESALKLQRKELRAFQQSFLKYILKHEKVQDKALIVKFPSIAREDFLTLDFENHVGIVLVPLKEEFLGVYYNESGVDIISTLKKQGFKGGGKPPKIVMKMPKTVTLEDALEQANLPFTKFDD